MPRKPGQLVEKGCALNSQQATDALETELASEQAHVDKVYGRLAAAAHSARQVAAEGQALYRTDRTNFVRDDDGTPMYERDVFAFQSAKRLATLDAEHEGLVFGRLDRTDGEVRYIGRIGVRDEDYEPLVIDWRARAAEPFYRATPADPMQVIRRRVLRSRGEVVVGIEDDLLDTTTPTDLVVLGEGALMAALSRARGSQMRDIVATIQAEQDEAIRAPYPGVTMITGGPGTGKTVVALHRAAYLLYSNRRRFESGGVLVVGPSQVFMNYIERVLPSLGEDAVSLRPIGGLAVDTLGITSASSDSVAAHRIKGSVRMVRLLRWLVDLTPEAALSASTGESLPGTRLRVSVKGEVLSLDAPQLNQIRRSVLRQRRYNLARPDAERAVLQNLWEQWERREKSAAAAEIDRDAFDDLVTSTAGYRELFLSWWAPLTPPQVLRRLGDPVYASAVPGDLISASEASVLSDDFRARQLPDGGQRWSVGDIALLDELATILGPPPPAEVDEDSSVAFASGGEVGELVTTADRMRRPREFDPEAEEHDTFAHILLDEAQDITPMQWRMLRRRGGSASWTIVGDLAQSSWPDPAESQRAIDDLTGRGPARRFRMSTNYRSPAEVFEFASDVVRREVPDADLPEAVRRTGQPPELRLVPGHELVVQAAGIVSDLGSRVDGTIGLIAPPSRLATLRSELPSLLDPQVRDRLALISPLEAKGLEYDATVVVAPDQIVAESPGGVRVLYVALTRPTQLLVTVDIDTPGSWRPTQRTEPIEG